MNEEKCIWIDSPLYVLRRTTLSLGRNVQGTSGRDRFVLHIDMSTGLWYVLEHLHTGNIVVTRRQITHECASLPNSLRALGEEVANVTGRILVDILVKHCTYLDNQSQCSRITISPICRRKQFGMNK